jgi:hypothetical protein
MKTIFTTSLVLLFTGVTFANNNVQTDKKINSISIQFEKNDKTVTIQNTLLTVKATEDTTSNSNLRLSQFYDIECSNGSTAHKAFDSYQAAHDWAMKFCPS